MPECLQSFWRTQSRRSTSVHGWRYRRSCAAGISATKVDVYANGEKDLPREVFWEQQENDHAHEHSHSHDHSHEHRHDHGRTLTEIRKIIEKAVHRQHREGNRDQNLRNARPSRSRDSQHLHRASPLSRSRRRRCHGRYRLRCGGSGISCGRRMGMLTAKHRRRNRQVRARNASRTGASHAEVASECASVFVGTTGRTGDAHRRGDRRKR